MDVAKASVTRKGANRQERRILFGVAAEGDHVDDGVGEPSVILLQQFRGCHDVDALALVVAVAIGSIEGQLAVAVTQKRGWGWGWWGAGDLM